MCVCKDIRLKKSLNGMLDNLSPQGKITIFDIEKNTRSKIKKYVRAAVALGSHLGE